jgi:lysozyme
MSVSGIDVSDYQGAVDWPAAARAGVQFALAKATEGETFVARTFAANWTTMQDAGIIRGAYHFFRPLDDPRVQAELFLQTVLLGQADLPAALDLEARDGVDPGAFVVGAGQWLDIVKTATGRPPLIYTSPGFWGTLGAPRGFSDYPLWIADYDRSFPEIPRGWATYTLWQYTATGSVGGVTGNVDLDVFNGSAADLTAFVERAQLPSGRRVSDDFVYEGDIGPEVKEIQTLLRGHGLDPGSADGVFGPRTKAAVIVFQRTNNLVVDGIVGPQTLAKLRA